MLRELKFVQGAVAKKDFIPAMTHFSIRDGRVSAFNGKLALSSPIQCDLECKPKAIPMVQAIGRCGETIQLTMTPAGRLSIKSGSFKAFVECIEDEMPDMQPEGELVECNGAHLLKALKVVQPFIGNDASRQWTNGVLLRGQSAYATNNVCLVEYWIGSTFPHVVNIPRDAVAEVLRINEEPTHLQISNNSMTFHYSDGRWIRTQLFGVEWPDLSAVLDAEHNATPVNKQLFEGLEMIKPFTDKNGRVLIEGLTVRTHEDPSEGASFELAQETILPPSSFQVEMLLLLADSAETLDLTAHPAPCLFFGDRLRGAVIGLRL